MSTWSSGSEETTALLLDRCVGPVRAEDHTKAEVIRREGRCGAAGLERAVQDELARFDGDAVRAF